MSIFEAKFEGADEMKAKLMEIARRAPEIVAAELKLQGELIMTQSKQYVPARTGALMNSGYVEEPVIEADGTVSVSLGYGGVAADYALAVHEFPDPAFIPPSWRGKADLDWNRPGSGPKYLERAINERAPRMMADMAESLDLTK